MLSIILQHHISKASILFLSDFFKVHPSTPYWNTAHTIDFMTLTFVAVFIFRSFQILASTTAFCLTIAMRLLISLVQSPSADLYDPRNVKSCTWMDGWMDDPPTIKITYTTMEVGGTKPRGRSRKTWWEDVKEDSKRFAMTSDDMQSLRKWNTFNSAVLLQARPA